MLTQFLYADLATDLLKASDQGRGGIQEGISWKAKILTVENNEESEREFFVQAKLDNAYVQAIAPARNKGEVYLFNDREMWFFKPSLKKPVAISSRQKLTGQAANGDIASTHYSRDYNATLEKTEQINGEKFHVLILKAKSSKMTYDQIRYWISDKDKLAKKAEFLTLQGQVFKLAEIEYNNFLLRDSKKYPFVSRLTISDAKFKNNKSTINYSDPKIENISDSLFKVNNLTR
jgi:hypothetical protein